MRERVAEHVLRPRPLAPPVRVRVDLHGVSVFGPGSRRTLIRWEWMIEIAVEDSVVVRAANAEIRLPRESFALSPDALAARLEEARSIERRPDVIGELAGSR